MSRQFVSLLKTQHGIICPDCKQEIAHVCRSHPSIASSSLQDNHTIAQAPSATHGHTVSVRSTQPLPTTSFSHPAQSHAQISVAPLAVSSMTGTSSSFPNPQRNFSSSCLGNGNLTELDFESASKKAQGSGFQSSQSSAAISEYPQSLEASSLPLPAISAPRTPLPSVVLPITFEDCPSIGKQEIPENWSITYNQVQKVVDVRLIQKLHVENDSCLFCTKLSKDGKYLALGFHTNGVTIIYDIQTGKKSWLVCFF